MPNKTSWVNATIALKLNQPVEGFKLVDAFRKVCEVTGFSRLHELPAGGGTVTLSAWNDTGLDIAVIAVADGRLFQQAQVPTPIDAFRHYLGIALTTTHVEMEVRPEPLLRDPDAYFLNEFLDLKRRLEEVLNS